MYGMPLWRLMMSEQEVPAARDDLACEMPTQQTAHPSAMNADKWGSTGFEERKEIQHETAISSFENR